MIKLKDTKGILEQFKRVQAGHIYKYWQFKAFLHHAVTFFVQVC